ncbi:MAG: hypothetical protein Q9209_005476 [Squamulea sp. 1 TL-2023]
MDLEIFGSAIQNAVLVQARDGDKILRLVGPQTFMQLSCTHKPIRHAKHPEDRPTRGSAIEILTPHIGNACPSRRKYFSTQVDSAAETNVQLVDRLHRASSLLARAEDVNIELPGAFCMMEEIDQRFQRIAPNAVVSFLATLANSSFLLATTETIGQLKWLHYHGNSHRLSDIDLFDQASRGPLGALKLLVFKRKTTLLASIAAVIVLAALFVDPFVQLVFSFPSRRTLASAQNSSFQTATIYDPNRSMLNHVVSPAHMVDAKILVAFLRGLYSGMGQPIFSCPARNCTWTDLTTLGICGECDDITSQIKIDCPGWYTSPDKLESYLCKYTMPSNNTLDGWLMSPAPAHTMWNSSAVQKDMSSTDATFTQVEAIQLSDVITAANGIRVLPSPKGTRCTFAFCTKTYTQIDVTSGVLSISAPEEDVLTLGTRSNESCDPSTCGTPLYQYLIPQSPVSRDDTQSNYRINYADREYITTFITNMFGTGWGDLGLSDTTQYGRPLAYSRDLNQTIKSIAASMTEVIRTGPNSTSNVGVSYVERTFIEIRWGYLAYPIVLVLLTMVVLVAVILKTRRHGGTVWKNSALALLFHELKGWEMPARKITNVQELDQKAAGMRGSLVDGGGISGFTKKD